MRLLPVVCLVALFALPPNPLAAGQCDTLIEQVKSQKNLIHKKKLLQRAVEVCPAHADLHYQYAYCLERLRKYEKALGYYIKASDLGGNTRAGVFFGMGDVYVILGNLKPAIEAYEKGLEREPGNQRAMRSLELARIKLKAQSGSHITPEEFTQVMTESKASSSTATALDGPVLQLQIQFAFASAELIQEAQQQLAAVGTALGAPALAAEKFEVAGHTDNSGEPENNLKLSRARAEAVITWLMSGYRGPALPRAGGSGQAFSDRNLGHRRRSAGSGRLRGYPSDRSERQP